MSEQAGTRLQDQAVRALEEMIILALRAGVPRSQILTLTSNTLATEAAGDHG